MPESMRLIRDRAIILRAVPFEDRHRVVTAITETHGRISALARNSVQSRRFGGALDVFTASEWQFAQRSELAELVQLQEARTLRSHEGLRADFFRMAMASLFSELLLRVAPEREACVDLFKLHANALAALEELTEQSPPISFLNGYLAKLLQWSGNQPRLQQCLGCARTLPSIWQEGNPSRLALIVQEAGWVCESCRRASVLHVRSRSEAQGVEMLEVGADAMADFFMSLVTPIRQVPATAHASDASHRELFRALEALLIYHVPGFDRLPLNSLKFLGLESSWQPPQDSRR
jgi:DNA repair protein RecO (recombination protein O)